LLKVAFGRISSIGGKNDFALSKEGVNIPPGIKRPTSLAKEGGNLTLRSKEFLKHRYLSGEMEITTMPPCPGKERDQLSSTLGERKKLEKNNSVVDKRRIGGGKGGT